MAERRRYPRNSGRNRTPVSFVVEGDNGSEVFEGTLVDHSAGGMQIITDAEGMNVGMELYIRINAGDPPVEREVSGKVVWLTNSSREKRIGLEYCYPLLSIPYFF
ncbi:MAG: PilZ domain-containing protein [Nitrospinae bacterium]|nr:PilZ domain-containing protein [Nitrospinota bacterium]